VNNKFVTNRIVKDHEIRRNKRKLEKMKRRERQKLKWLSQHLVQF